MDTTVSAFNAVENAQRRLGQAEAMQADLIANNADTMASHNAVINAQATATQALERVTTRYAVVAVAAFREIISVSQEATESYTDFAKMAMNIRDLTGASGGDAARLTTLFQGFGISDRTAMRDILRLSRDTLTPHGQNALHQLGIDPNTATSGIDLFNQVADKLQGVHDGIQKTALMQQIFGVRGVDAFLPLLRATHEQREAMMALSGVNEQGLEVVQRWQFANNLLGETFEQRVVFPIVGLVLPALIKLVEGATWVVDMFGKVNQATHGWAGLALVIGAMAGATALFAASLIGLVGALGASTIALNIQNIALGIRDALLGPPGWAALAVAATVGFAIAGFSAFEGSHQGSTQQAHTEAVRDNTAALRDMKENWNLFNHGGIPNGLGREDLQQLARQNALGAIG